MPITIPPFDQYQAPIVPLRGLWNNPPPEGDKFALIEIDWLITTKNTAVQLLLSANSPVALSQIVALSVDNRNSGYDINFVFPDSGFVLTVPAYNQVVAPVFTNALMFYAVADPNVVTSNRTVFMVLNSMPPPVALNPTAMQTVDAVNSIPVAAGTTQIIASGINGTINGMLITLNFSATEGMELQLIDGAGNLLWQETASGIAGASEVFPISGLHIRFVNGVHLVISNVVGTAGNAQVNVNLFYTTP